MNKILRTSRNAEPRAALRPLLASRQRSKENINSPALGYPRLTTVMAGHDEIVASIGPFRTTPTRLNSDEIALAPDASIS